MVSNSNVSELAPTPEITFRDLELSAPLMSAVDALGWKTPTPVQRAVFEPILQGRDVIVQSQTGSGKTGAFALPVIERLGKAHAEPQVLILAPTRELAVQSGKVLDALGRAKQLRSTTLYGGVSVTNQIRDLERGVDLISGTPGRILDHLERGTLNPRTLSVLVLDEADQMLSMGFAKELHAIMEQLPVERQTLLLSATIDEAVKRLAARHMRDPLFLSLSSGDVAPNAISHTMYMVSGVGRTHDLVKVLRAEEPPNAIVFCNTKSDSEHVYQTVNQQGLSCALINGDMPQKVREDVMNQTRSGKVRLLIATDVAARGIDISHITHVINYELPENPEQYVHRTGRTGRAGRTGKAIALVAPGELASLYQIKLIYGIAPVERSLPSAVEEQSQTLALQLQTIAQVLERQIAQPLAQSLAKRLLTHPEAEQVVAGLLSNYLQSEAKKGISPGASSAEASRSPVKQAPK